MIQYWFDDVRSLTLKYIWARNDGIRGVGPFTFSDLSVLKWPIESRAMWNSFDSFLQGSGDTQWYRVAGTVTTLY